MTCPSFRDQAVFQFHAASQRQLFSGPAAHLRPVLREDQPGQAVLEALFQLRRRIAHQGGKVFADPHERKPPVISAALDAAPQAAQGCLPLAGVLRFRCFRLPPDRQSLAGVQIIHVDTQQGGLVPAVIADHGAVDPIAVPVLHQPLGKKLLAAVFQKFQHPGAVVRMDRPLDQIAHGLRKARPGAQQRKIRIGIVDHVVDPLIQIHLYYGGVHIAQQRQVFDLGGLQHIQPPGVRDGDVVRREGSSACGGRIVGIGAGQRRKRIPQMLEALQQLRGEAAARSVQNHIHGLLMGAGVLIAPVGGQCLVSVRQAYRLRPEWDTLPPESVGISLALPPLMVIAADVPGITQVFPVAHAVQLLQHAAADGGMGLHHLEFLRRQLARLVEDSVRYGDLADVVQRGGGGDNGDLPPVQLVLRTAARQFLQ